ncbi:putative pectate lyase protein [Bacillus phage vB_BmeM-Goe8]|uniref:Putative pectate lyase protein n=1 Tax=Bacillus phage vB_BmeM-Goe8 TaxID=2593638 RepID=A0A516KMY9_9CAUD|nr:putative pectate lyase protein [Bacillus phage vB_BmeM-Goe8]QDP42968.1 putative pectate lyase protein [Bacillus phage vB_BmeM-Goe8]
MTNLFRDNLYDNFPDPRELIKNEIGDKTSLPQWLQASLREVVQRHEEYLKQVGVNIKQPPFNAVGDGVADDTKAINDALASLKDGAILLIPGGYTFRISSTVPVNKRCMLTGGGKIINSDGMNTSYHFEVTADNTSFHKLVMDNPKMLKSQTGNRQGAINIKANYVSVTGCTFYRMLQGISQASSGEFVGAIVANNYFLEHIGAGDGATNDTSNYGEDRGDAVTLWGAGSMIIGNYAQCMAGQDARIAFHAEGYAVNIPTPNPAKDNKDFIIANNIAVGSFRRHFVFEDLFNGVISNNVSYGGATWWSLCIVQAKNCRFDNNILHFTREATDKSGAKWAPVYAAVVMMNYSEGVTLSNNQIYMADNAAGKAFHSQTLNTGVHTNTRIVGNTVIHKTGSTLRGIDLTGLTNPIVKDNLLNGFNQGIYSFKNSKGAYVFGNHLDNCATSYYFEGDPGSDYQLSLSGGAVLNSATGISVQNIDDVKISGVDFKNISQYDLNIWTYKVLVVDGICNTDGTGKLRLNGNTSGTLSATVATQIGDTPGFAHSWKHNATAVTSITSSLNTWGKYAGKVVIDANNQVYMSTGTTAASIWVSLSGGTSVTPA